MQRCRGANPEAPKTSANLTPNSRVGAVSPDLHDMVRAKQQTKHALTRAVYALY